MHLYSGIQTLMSHTNTLGFKLHYMICKIYSEKDLKMAVWICWNLDLSTKHTNCPKIALVLAFTQKCVSNIAPCSILAKIYKSKT